MSAYTLAWIVPYPADFTRGQALLKDVAEPQTFSHGGNSIEYTQGRFGPHTVYLACPGEMMQTAPIAQAMIQKFPGIQLCLAFELINISVYRATSGIANINVGDSILAIPNLDERLTVGPSNLKTAQSLLAAVGSYLTSRVQAQRLQDIDDSRGDVYLAFPHGKADNIKRLCCAPGLNTVPFLTFHGPSGGDDQNRLRKNMSVLASRSASDAVNCILKEI
ncbi:hypothetical protein ACHAQJ_008713 [Trichoderma viride]